MSRVGHALRNATWQGGLALVAATIGATALGYLIVQVFFLPETVAQARLDRVPDLTGRSFDDAVREASAEGYDVLRAGRLPSDDVDEGSVIYQLPPPESYLQRGDTLWVLTSRGPDRAVLPDLAGLDPDVARSVLTQLGLTTTADRREASDLYDQGTVVETVPPAGTPIGDDTRVTLVLSRGGSLLVMPDVTGLSLAAARDSLEAAGLTVGEVGGMGAGPGGGEGRVVVTAQDPRAYRRVRAGAAVRLQLGEARGPTAPAAPATRDSTP